MSEAREKSLAAHRVEVRPVSPEDRDFLIAVYGSTREELKQVPWDEAQRLAFVTMQYEAQDAYYREKFPHAAYDLIIVDGERAGRLYVLRVDDQMRIMDIALLPQYRNSGIGTPLIRQLMKEAAESGLPLRIYLEQFNSSRPYFERLGFSPIEESEYNLLYEWRSEVSVSPA